MLIYNFSTKKRQFPLYIQGIVNKVLDVQIDSTHFIPLILLELLHLADLVSEP